MIDRKLEEAIESARLNNFDINQTYWLRHDFPSCDHHEQNEEWDMVRDKLESHALELIDVQLEHDCISGHVQLIDDKAG